MSHISVVEGLEAEVQAELEDRWRRERLEFTRRIATARRRLLRRGLLDTIAMTPPPTPRGLGMTLVLAFVLPAAGAAAHAQAGSASPIRVAEDKPGLLERAKISADSATKLAAAAVPNGRVTSGEIEEEREG